MPWFLALPGHKPGGGTRSENCWGCAAGHWKLDPKRSREKWYFGAKKIEFCEDLYPKDRFCVGGWEKTPQKDRARSCQSEKRGSKPRHICITHHIGSTPPGGISNLGFDNQYTGNKTSLGGFISAVCVLRYDVVENANIFICLWYKISKKRVNNLYIIDRIFMLCGPL